jgi:two-component system chemotaxis response regulator CheY
MKALLVDDDIVSRMALVDLLSAYGIFELVEAQDGEAAWALLEAGLRPAICFCDVRMPRMSGIELLQRIQAQPALSELSFALVSSASDRDAVLQAVRLGAVGYILKPLHAADARAHLERIFKLTLDKLAENPVATLKRPNIGPDRLTAYRRAFQDQLAAGRKETAALLDAGAANEAGLRIDRVNRALADVADAVGRQLDRVKLLASSGAPELTGAVA